MKKYNTKLYILCFICAFLAGCSKQSENNKLENVNYTISEFDMNNVQQIENFGVALSIPINWNVSVSEETGGKTVTINFEQGVMTVGGYYSDNKFVQKQYVDSYKKTYQDEAITDNREENYSNQQMDVFDWIDEVNGNKIHGTTYLFVVENWYYNISFSTYQEILYKEELGFIMDTFTFDGTILQDFSEGNETEIISTEIVEEPMEELEELSNINITFVKDYVDEDGLNLKVYVKNISDKSFSGDVHVFFYSYEGKRLGEDMIIVENLQPGRESWTNVIIENYSGVPRLEIEFTNPVFEELETIVVEVDKESTENVKNSFYLNFDGVSWYNDVIEIVVYIDGSCVVTVKDGAKEEGQFYASVIWECGKDYGVNSVQVIDTNGTIQTIYP